MHWSRSWKFDSVYNLQAYYHVSWLIKYTNNHFNILETPFQGRDNIYNIEWTLKCIGLNNYKTQSIQKKKKKSPRSDIMFMFYVHLCYHFFVFEIMKFLESEKQ